MKTIDNKPFWYNPRTCESYAKKPESLTNLEHWDSILEFNVYEQLLKEFPLENIKRQHEIILLEKNALFPKWSWVIDFKLFGADNKPIFIEAKGKWLINHPDASMFAKTLRMLQIISPEIFNRLLIVGDGCVWQIPKTKLFVYPHKNVNTLIKAIIDAK